MLTNTVHTYLLVPFGTPSSDATLMGDKGLIAMKTPDTMIELSREKESLSPEVLMRILEEPDFLLIA